MIHEKKEKFSVDFQKVACYYNKADARNQKNGCKKCQKKVKKLLTNSESFDIVQKLSRVRDTTKEP